MKKILFVLGLGSPTEYQLFAKLAEAMGAYIMVGGTTPPITDPDIIVNLHGAPTSKDLASWGITSNPIKVFYALGQSRPYGPAMWGENFEIWNDHFFGYGAMNQALDVPFGFLPLPIDVSEIPARGAVTGKQFCQAISKTGFKQTGKTKRLLKELGYDLTVIYDLPKADALALLAQHNVYIGNHNFGNLGKAELEAMAAGLAVVGWLKPEVRAMYETLGASFPYVDTTLAEFIERVNTTTQAQVNNRGQASRTWMLENYTLEKLALVWRTALEALQ